MKKEIIKKFKEQYKDSSLFNSYDDCEEDLIRFIGGVYDIAYNLGWREKYEQVLKEMKNFTIIKNDI